MRDVIRITLLTITIFSISTIGIFILEFDEVYAIDVENAGIDVTYSYDPIRKELTIDGFGDMTDWNRSGMPWYTYRNDITSVIISEGITSVGNSAFEKCTSLTFINMPNSIVSIGDYAFYGCTSLAYINMSDNVTNIGIYAFYNCSSLTEVNIPDSVTSIGSSAFYGCAGLKYLTLPIDISITEYMFYNSTDLSSVTFTKGQTGKGVSYSSYSYLNSNYYQYTPWYKSRSSLTDVIILDGVTSIGNNAFHDSFSLTEINIPNSVTNIGNSAFYGCTSLASVTIPNSVTDIGNSAFYGCSLLSTIAIGNGVTSIGNSAFCDCSSLTEVNIPDSVTDIGDYAFYGCVSLAEFNISSGVVYIGNNTLQNCTSLMSINVDEDNLKYTSLDGVLYNKTKTELIQCPKANNKNIIIPDSITNISYAFSGCTSLASVTIPNSVTDIGDYAFYDCSSLTEINIPNNVTSIGNSAFYGCTSLVSVIIPDSVTNIGNSAFYGCTSLVSVIIPDSVTNIGNSAFYGCTSIAEINIPHSVTFIGSHAFSGCTSLVSVIIPDSVTNIGNSAFYGCTSLVSVIIPDSVTNIGNSAFYGCTSIAEINIPHSVTFIGSHAFSGCTSIAEINIPHGVTLIESYAFSGCTSLVSVTIPNSVTGIGHYVFYDCSSLTEINIPSSVTNIGDYAFYDCSSLTEINIPDSVTDIGDYAFYGCAGLKSLTLPIDIPIKEYTFYDSTNLSSVTLTKGQTGKGVSHSYVNPFLYGFEKTPWYKSRSNLTSISISDGVISIGDCTFYDCYRITEVNIPSSVTSIGSEAFYNCYRITEVNIPSSVTSIGSEAFYHCYRITEVNIPSSVTYIGSCAFSQCSSLTSINVDESNEKYVDMEGVLYNKERTVLIQYPQGKSDSEYLIWGEVINIGDYAFSNCYMLKSVTIPNSVISINNYAFENCTGLTSLTMPIDVPIKEDVFRNVTNLSSICLTKGQTGEGTSYSIDIFFSNNYQHTPWYGSRSNLTNVIISDGVVSVGNYTFYRCSPQTNIRFLDDAPAVGIDWAPEDTTIYYYAGKTGFDSGAEKWKNNELKKITNLDLSLGYLAYIPDQSYSGGVIEPDLSIILEDINLFKGIDYTVLYTDNINTGIATVTVVGINNYTGLIEGTFNIKKDISRSSILDYYVYFYTGGPIEPPYELILDNVKLIEGIDYIISYTNNNCVGTATATMDGIGNYFGTKTINFYIGIGSWTWDEIIEKEPRPVIRISDDATGTEINNSVFQKLAEKKKVMTIDIINSEGYTLYSWIFGGTYNENIEGVFRIGITEIPPDEDVESLMSSINAKSSLILNFSASGNLPVDATVKYYVGDKYSDRTNLTLLFYNEEMGDVEIKAQKLVVTDGYVKFNPPHFSTYILAEFESENNATTHISIGAAIIAILVIVAVAVFIKRR